MLRGYRDTDMKIPGTGLKVTDYQGHLDGFRTGTKNEEGFYHAFASGLAVSWAGSPQLAMAESDTAFGEVVGGKFEGDFIARQNANAIAAESACEVGQDKPFVLKLHTKFAAGELLDDGTLYFYAVFFTHSVRYCTLFRYIVAGPVRPVG